MRICTRKASGLINVVRNISSNATLVIEESEAREIDMVRSSAQPLFADVSDQILQGIEHQESGYIDFKREPLLAHMFSKRGPAVAVADVNGDGLEDIFVGGAANSPASLFYQQPDRK